MGLYLRHPSSFEHDTGPHPESARRLTAIEEAMSARDWLGMKLVEAPAATREQLLSVHDAGYLAAVEDLCRRGGGSIDLDTVISDGSWQAALHAAGGAAHAVDLLLGDGDERRFAFCGLRPPGHHAERGRAMGFCLLNNVAVAAAHAAAEHEVERTLVLDWDVHHGNGTEAIFCESPEVLYASIHQSPLYPGTGASSDLGAGAGEGYTINLPVAPGSGRDEYLSLLQHLIAPVAQEWRPELICISAGYDAHRDDPLADCELDEGAFAEMAAVVRDLGVEVAAPVLVCLEGGYALGALANSVVATLEALGGSLAAKQAPAAPAESRRMPLAAHWPILA